MKNRGGENSQRNMENSDQMNRKMDVMRSESLEIENQLVEQWLLSFQVVKIGKRDKG